jgi:hypothetical protein
MSKEELDKKLRDDYFMRCKLMYEVFPDMLIPCSWKAGFELKSFEQYYTEQKIKYFMEQENV